MVVSLIYVPIPLVGSLVNCRTLTTNASIWTAAELGDAVRVSTLIREKGRSPNALDPHGYTPLHLAAQRESHIHRTFCEGQLSVNMGCLRIIDWSFVARSLIRQKSRNPAAAAK